MFVRSWWNRRESFAFDAIQQNEFGRRPDGSEFGAWSAANQRLELCGIERTGLFSSIENVSLESFPGSNWFMFALDLIWEAGFPESVLMMSKRTRSSILGRFKIYPWYFSWFRFSDLQLTCQLWSRNNPQSPVVQATYRHQEMDTALQIPGSRFM